MASWPYGVHQGGFGAVGGRHDNLCNAMHSLSVGVQLQNILTFRDAIPGHHTCCRIQQRLVYELETSRASPTVQSTCPWETRSEFASNSRTAPGTRVGREEDAAVRDWELCSREKAHASPRIYHGPHLTPLWHALDNHACRYQPSCWSIHWTFPSFDLE